LNVAVAAKTTPNQYFGLAIGFVIVAGAYGAGAVSGGCFNPAVAIGIDVSSAHLGIGWCLVYTVCELAGAGLAAGLFKVVRPNGGEESEEYSNTSKLVSEFLGTYVLVLTVGLNVLGQSKAGAFSIAASLMCMIYALGDVSGANFNPAVTVALIIHKALDATTGAMYIGAQIAGGIAAAATYTGIYSGKTFPLGPGNHYNMGQACVAELVFTAVLVLVVLCAAVKPKTHSDNFFGLAIGSCVTVGGCAIGAVSGGSLNPAVSFGIGTVSFSFANAAIYSVVEIIGASIAAGLVMATHAEGEEEEEKKP
jgi:aquaporin Z